MEFKELFNGKDELWKQVSEVLGDTKVLIDDGKLIPKHRLDEVSEKAKTLQGQVDAFEGDKQKAIEEALKEKAGQLTELNKQIEELKKDSGNSKELQEKLEKLSEENNQKIEQLKKDGENSKAEYDKKVAQLTKERSVESLMYEAGVKSGVKFQALKSILMNDADLILDGDNANAKTKIEAIKSSDPEFFGQTKVTGAKTDLDVDDTKKSFYTREEVDAMSSQDRRANYKEIMESQKSWT